MARTREVPWLEVVEQSSYVADLSDISSIYKQGSRRVTWAWQEWPHCREIHFTMAETWLSANEAAQGSDTRAERAMQCCLLQGGQSGAAECRLYKVALQIVIEHMAEVQRGQDKDGSQAQSFVGHRVLS